MQALQTQRSWFGIAILGGRRLTNFMNINHYPQDWHDKLHRQLDDFHHQYPQAHMYALIEGALNESCYPLLKRSRHPPYRALYDDTPNADDETLCLSPILVEYTPSNNSVWATVLRNTDGLSALSLIVTTESLAQLADRLVPWCIVDAAGHTLALSFADTRILPELVKVLTPVQMGELCGPASRWQYVNRKAEWETLSLPQAPNPPSIGVSLDESQCASLIGAAEADYVLYQLRTSGSSVVDCNAPARTHELLRYWLACADHAQIESVPDRVELCEIGLAYPALENHPRVAAWRAAPSKAQTVASLREQWLQNSLA
jgi:hypothetical protein